MHVLKDFMYVCGQSAMQVLSICLHNLFHWSQFIKKAGLIELHCNSLLNLQCNYEGIFRQNDV